MKHFKLLKDTKELPKEEPAFEDQDPEGDPDDRKKKVAKPAPKQANQRNISNSFKVYAKLENNFHLSNKYALFYNMRKYYRNMNKDPFDVLPVTFHLKNGQSDPEYTRFKHFY